MTENTWTITLNNQARKALKKLPPKTCSTFIALLNELEKLGPNRYTWPNFGKLNKDCFHCHIEKGRPTYVVCWQIINKKENIIEVYYAGTHEKAPY